MVLAGVNSFVFLVIRYSEKPILGLTQEWFRDSPSLG